MLDQHLRDLEDNDLLFKFEYRNAKKIIDRAVERAGIKCIPNGEKVTWKDLRSGMACDLLKKGYTTDEVNARLGHKPSSDEIDKYVNFLAIDRHTPKKKVHRFEMEKLNEELQEVKQREKLQILRNQEIGEDMQLLQKDFAKMEKLNDPEYQKERMKDTLHEFMQNFEEGVEYKKKNISSWITSNKKKVK
ncbi:MAG: site-specific integrase [Bacteroidetes bacterium]|nr:site-specific integrase [Bacteroidota bacterium]